MQILAVIHHDMPAKVFDGGGHLCPCFPVMDWKGFDIMLDIIFCRFAGHTVWRRRTRVQMPRRQSERWRLFRFDAQHKSGSQNQQPDDRYANKQYFHRPILAWTIHKYCRALACSFARNESLVPQGIISCAIPQGTLPAASGIHLGAIHLIGRPYAWLLSPPSEWPLRGHAVCCEQSSGAIITAIYE